MKCKNCRGSGSVYVVDRVVQGQDYGGETEGHSERCSSCSGTGEILPPTTSEQKTPSDVSTPVERT